MIWLAAASLLQAGSPADPIAATFVGMYTEVEDDVAPQNNAPIERVMTRGCVTSLIAARHTWPVYWSAARNVALEDVFIFIDAPPLKLAVVADAGTPAGQARLKAMHAAMVAKAAACRPH